MWRMQRAGFRWDPAHGYPRWTHPSGVTALRQPYMNDQQWIDHCAAKIAEAKPTGAGHDIKITKDEAIAYARKHGLQFVLEEPQERKIKPKAYADNFR